MSTSKQPTPDGNQYTINFKQSVNLDAVDETVYGFDSAGGPCLTNTGILRDDGVTNIYETTTTDAAGTVVMYTSGGDKISIASPGAPTGGRAQVSVNGEIVGNIYEGRMEDGIDIPFDVYDVALSTTGTLILLTKESLKVEFNPATKTVIQSAVLDLGTGTIDACLVKTKGMTFSATDYVYAVNSSGSFVCIASISGVKKTVVSTGGAPFDQFLGLAAFSYDGTFIVSGLIGGASMPRSRYSTSPYTTWTVVAECSFLAPVNRLVTSGALAPILIGTPWVGSASNFTSFGTLITLNIGGGAPTIVPITVAGLSITPSDTYTGFGFASGLYTSTAATLKSPFILANGSVVRQDKTVTAYGVKPQSVSAISASTADSVVLVTIDGVPSHVAMKAGALLTPVGDVNSTRPVTVWNHGALDYILIRRSVGAILVKYGANSNDIRYSMKEVSRTLVQFNDESGVLLRTDTKEIENNQGSFPGSFISDIFLSGVNQIALQSESVYSNSIDLGIVQNVAGITAGSVYQATDYVGNPLVTTAPMVVYQGAAGSLFQVARYIYTTFIAPTSPDSAYVSNPNLPTPFNAEFEQGGISFPVQSALQTINFASAYGFAPYYAGYLVVNQYSVRYKFFNLFGQLYGFDGTKIYRMPVNGAVAGTPEQVAIASGLVFITNAPTMAWFWSAFDNAVYIFDGGQSVTKWQEMTGKSLVVSGEYSVIENALYLQLSDNTVVVFRDEIAGVFANPYSTQTIYATDTGTFFVSVSDPRLTKKWTYYIGSGTPIALTWQSGFYGFGRNQYARISYVVFTLKILNSATTNVIVNYKWLTANDTGTETKTFTGGTYTASSTGYARFKYCPTNPLVYGASVGISCSSKVTLYECIIYYTDGGVAPIPNVGP